MDPALKRVQRAVKEARERGGMTVGMSKVTLDCNDVVRLLTVAYRCPHVVTREEGTQYCALGETRVRELEAERDQWQESSGQNYVRATEAEMRADRLEAENARLREALVNTAANLAATISLLDSYGMRDKRPVSMADYDRALGNARAALETTDGR